MYPAVTRYLELLAALRAYLFLATLVTVIPMLVITTVL